MRDFAKAYRMGAPESPETDLGPLASFPHREHVERYVEIGRKEGATVLAGGARPTGGIFDKGAYYPATLLTDVDNTARVCREEIFGPVAVVIPFENEDDLLQQANDTDFGLASGIWTGNYQRAWRVARALRAGTVWINTYKQASISTPFGGFKQSGTRPRKGLARDAGLYRSEGHFLGFRLVGDTRPSGNLTRRESLETEPRRSQNVSLLVAEPPANGSNASSAATAR